LPKILRPNTYGAINATAKKIFSQRSVLDKYAVRMKRGDPLYRYVGYRNLMGQQERSGRTIWARLEDDTNNRWTGLAADGKTGTQGLYLSQEFPGSLDTRFSELEHYQDSTLPPNQEVAYFEYAPGKEPAWTRAKASELRSMFLFTLSEVPSGVNFQFDSSPASLLSIVLEQARRDFPTAFTTVDTPDELYFSANDATFNRAVGNALFETTDYQFFQATSVRDSQAINLVLRATQGTPIEILKPQGRATFLIDAQARQTKAVYTIDDLIYNREFEETGLGIIAPRKELVTDLSVFEGPADGMSKDFDWEFATRNIDTAISAIGSEALDKMIDPFDKDIETLIAELSTPKLKESLYKVLKDFALASAAASTDYLTLYDTIGREGIQSLFDNLVVEARYNRLMTGSGGSLSYLDIALKSVLLEKKFHWLAQNSSDIQSRLTDTVSKLSETKEEIAARQAALSEVGKQLSTDPENTALQKQQSGLQDEVDELVREKREAEQKRALTEKAQDENTKATREMSGEKEETDRELSARRQNFIEGK